MSSIASPLFAMACLIAIGPLVVQANPQPPDEEFKIETQVFLDGSTTPVSINQTIFQKGLVFDFRLSATGDEILEATIFDQRKQRFVLMDPDRRVRLELDNLQLLRFVEGMKQELKNCEKTAFLLFDDATENYLPDTRQVTVENEFISYTATGNRPENDRLLQRYYDFLAHYTRLSTTDPRRLPPFPRMVLNQSMKKYGVMPGRVELELRSSDHAIGAFTAVSKHRVVTALDELDRQRIDQTKGNWMLFRAVGLAEYRDLDLPED